MNLKLITTLVAVSIVGAAIADNCCGGCAKMDKFTMEAMHMAKKADPIKGDRWAMDCKGACCSKDAKHAKHGKMSKKSKKGHRH